MIFSFISILQIRGYCQALSEYLLIIESQGLLHSIQLTLQSEELVINSFFLAVLSQFILPLEPISVQFLWLTFFANDSQNVFELGLKFNLSDFDNYLHH